MAGNDLTPAATRPKLRSMLTTVTWPPALDCRADVSPRMHKVSTALSVDMSIRPETCNRKFLHSSPGSRWVKRKERPTWGFFSSTGMQAPASASLVEPSPVAPTSGSGTGTPWPVITLRSVQTPARVVVHDLQDGVGRHRSAAAVWIEEADHHRPRYRRIAAPEPAFDRPCRQRAAFLRAA